MTNYSGLNCIRCERFPDARGPKAVMPGVPKAAALLTGSQGGKQIMRERGEARDEEREMIKFRD